MTDMAQIPRGTTHVYGGFKKFSLVCCKKKKNVHMHGKFDLPSQNI